MSLSISVTAPSGELIRLSAGVTGSSAEAITSIDGHLHARLHGRARIP